MIVEQVSGSAWAECPNGVESADGYSIIQKPFREEQLANKIHLALREGSLADG